MTKEELDAMIEAKANAKAEEKAQKIADEKIKSFERQQIPPHLQNAPAFHKNGLCKDGYDLNTPEGAALSFARATRALYQGTKLSGSMLPDFQKAAQVMKGWAGDTKMDSDDFLVKLLSSGAMGNNEDIRNARNTTFGQTKSVNGGTLEAGGFDIPDNYYSNVIEYLTAKVITYNIPGIETTNMTTGRLKLAKETNLITGSWVGEEGYAEPETPLSGVFEMFARKLMCIVIISNDWLRRSDTGNDRNVLMRMQKGISLTEDSGLWRGIGSQYTPLGVRYQIASGNLIPQSGTTNAAITTDLLGAVGAVTAANIEIQNPVWIMHPLKKTKLMSLRNATTDTLVFPETLQGRLYDAPILTSTAIPITLGGGGNESEIYYGEGSELLIGKTADIDISLSDSLSYIKSGTTVSAFSRDQSGLRVIKETDIFLRHSGGFACVTGVTW